MSNSPFEKVDIENMSQDEKNKLANPSYKYNTGKIGAKKEKKIGSQSTDKDPEDKTYIIFIVPDIGEHPCSYIGQTDSLNVNGEFTICKGRTDAYTFIRDLLSSNCNSYDDYCGINVLDSAVLVEGLSYNDKISMCKFMEYCEQFYPDDDFDINDYICDDLYEEENHPQATGVEGQNFTSMITNN